MKRAAISTAPVLALLLTALAGACGDDDARDDGPRTRGAGEKPLIATTFYPTTYLARRLAGDAADVVLPLPEGEDPIFWRPSDEALEVYRGADLIVINGADFEKWVDGVALPESRVVDTAKAFEDDFLHQEGETHSHGPQGEHTHAGIDGHTWLDPIQAKMQAQAIRDALVRILPEKDDEIARRHAALAADLDQLDAGWQEVAKAAEGKTILASHPAYDYLARRYGLDIVNLDLDPEVVPDAGTIAAIRAEIGERPIRAIIWESRPDEEVAGKLRAELGIESFVVSPCETLPEDAEKADRDYLDVMRAGMEAMRRAFA